MIQPRALSSIGTLSLLLAFFPSLVLAQSQITAGRTVTASLAATDATLGDGSHYHLYEYRGRAGEQIQVTMRSGAMPSDTRMPRTASLIAIRRVARRQRAGRRR